MTDEQMKTNLTAWVKTYCRDDFLIKNPLYGDEGETEYIESLPGGVEIFLDRAVVYIQSQSGIKSESLGDHSISYEMDMPLAMLKMLAPYKNMYPRRQLNTIDYRVLP